MEATQAAAPGQPQAQQPVHPIHEEAATLERFTRFVQDNPDNDPDHPENSSEPRPVETPQEQGQEAPESQDAEAVEFDDDTPVFDIEYKTDDGKESRKLSLKELREGWMAKQDYHRNIQRVKQQEAQIQEQVRQASMKAAQEYMQRLETNKQMLVRAIAPELQNVDLNRLAQEDPAEAQRLFFRQLQFNQAVQQIEAEQAQVRQKAEEERKTMLAQAVEKARATLESDVKGWSDELYGTVLKSMSAEYGLDKNAVAQVVDAGLIKVFHDAYQYRQLQKAKPEVSKKVVAVPKVLKPGTSVKANPAADTTQEAANRLRKSGKGDDFVAWYLAKQKQQGR